MTEQLRFESLFAERLAAYAARADRPFDASAVARAATLGHRPGLLDRLLPPVGGVDLRVLRIGLALALIAGLLAVLAVVGARLNEASRLVSLSQAVHQNPPAFTMTTTAYDIPGDGSSFHVCHSDFAGGEADIPSMQLRYLYDGAGHLRIECRFPGRGIPGGQGSGDVAFIIVGPDGRAGAWTGQEWFEDPAVLVRLPHAPVATVDWLNWINEGSFLPDEDLPVECASWTLGAVTQVAGRSAQEVSCGSERFWIDEASRLMVRREIDGRLISEAVELEVGIVPAAALFDPDTAQANVRWPLEIGGRVKIGEIPPDWTLELVGGGSFSSTDLRGQPSAVLIQGPDGPPVIGLEAFASVVAPRLDRMHSVAIATTASEAAGIPVVVDDGTTAPAWNGRPGVWLFGADGRIEAYLDLRSAGSLGSALDALLAGSVIPMAPAGDGVFDVGQPAPPLAGPLIGGGEFELTGTRGMPIVILNPGERNYMTGALVPLGFEPIAELAEASRLVGDRATFVVLAWETEFWLDGRGRGPRGASGLPFIHASGGTWSALRGPNARWDGGFRSRAAIVILDGDGIVRRVISDDLPSVEELIGLIEELAE